MPFQQKQKRTVVKVATVPVLVRELDMPEDEGWYFLVDSQDVAEIKEHFGNTAKLDQFDSFFACIADGDYQEVYGMQGIVPLTNKPVYRIWMELK